MTILIILLLIALGILLLLIEFAVIPGVTIAGIGGMALFAYSVYLAFSRFGTLAGIITLLFIIIAVPILFIRFFRGKIGKNMKLESTIKGHVNQVDEKKIAAGDQGVAITRLAPIGKAEVKNETYEAKSTGEFIDEGTPIEIIKVLPNQIIVKPIIKE